MEKEKVDFLRGCQFYVDGNPLDFYNAVKLWRKVFNSYEDFNKEIITHSGLQLLSEYMFYHWDTIPVYTDDEIFDLSLTERQTILYKLGPKFILDKFKPMIATMTENVKINGVEYTFKTYYLNKEDILNNKFGPDSIRYNKSFITYSGMNQNFCILHVSNELGYENCFFAKNEYEYIATNYVLSSPFETFISLFHTPICNLKYLQIVDDLCFFLPSNGITIYSDETSIDHRLTTSGFIKSLKEPLK